MVVLGIMLSKGLPNDKAKLYFDQFDIELTGQLSREKFVKMAETMISVAIDAIPKLTSEHGKFSIKADRINQYIYKLAKKRQTAVNKLADDFYAGKPENVITIQEFTSRFVKKDEMDYSKLSTAFGIRVYLNWIHANTPDETLSKGANVFAALMNKAKTAAPPADAEETKPSEEDKPLEEAKIVEAAVEALE